MNALPKTLQIALLFCFVAASVATSPAYDPGPRPLRVRTLPANFNDVILIPQNGSLFTYGVFEASATAAIGADAGTPAATDAGTPAETNEARVLDVEQQLPLQWARVDVSSLNTDVVYDVQLSAGAPVDELNTEVLQVMRTSMDDLIPPGLSRNLIVEQTLLQEGAPDQPEPAVNIDSSVEGPVERCALSLEFTVAGTREADVLLYLYQDGRVRKGAVFSSPQPLQLWLSGDDLPREETCFRVVAIDLAGNEASTDEVCIVPEGVDACA